MSFVGSVRALGGVIPFPATGRGQALWRGGFEVEGALPVAVDDALRTLFTSSAVLQLSWNIKVGTLAEFFWLLAFNCLDHCPRNHDGPASGRVCMHGYL